MFEEPFKKARSVERYLVAPLLQLCLGNLDHCVAQELVHTTIQEIARNQFAAVQLLPLDESGPIPVAEVEVPRLAGSGSRLSSLAR